MINYTCDAFKGNWTSLGTFTERRLGNDNPRRIQHIITDLPYAHVWYDVRIQMKAVDAQNIPEMWSNYTTFVFQTAGRRPDGPPETNIGAFGISANTGQISIFWKVLPEYKYNGDRFGYYVSAGNGVVWSSRHDSPSVISTSAKIRNIDGNALSKSVTYSIYSNNSLGNSLEAATVRVPAKRDRVDAPRDIKKIRKQTGYKIQWATPKNAAKITSYTVFWCEPNKELPNECNGPIDFKVLRYDELIFNFTTSTVYNFAISANSANSSSGMVWAMCTHGGGEINKMSNILVSSVGSRSITYEWVLDCIDRTILTKYELEMCSVQDPKKNACMTDSVRTYNISGNTTEYIVKDLTPYTIYRTRIRMISDDKVGPWSEPVEKNTMEAAPTPPVNLTVLNITNSSATLVWEKPVVENGVLTKYVVWLNNNERNVESEHGSKIIYQLMDLDSFTNYTVVVLAFTVDKSEPSNRITFQTDIGMPSIIEGVTFNQSESVTWNQPKIPAGRLQYYELQVEVKAADFNRVVKVPTNRCTLRQNIREIQGRGTYLIRVRAVNVRHSPHANDETRRKYGNDYGHQIVPRDVGQGYWPMQPEPICEEQLDDDLRRYLDRRTDEFRTELMGEWSSPLTYVDRGNENSLYVLIFLVVFATVFVYASFFIYNKYKGMGKIDIVLPNGVEDPNERKQKSLTTDDRSTFEVIVSPKNEATDRLLKKSSISSEETEDGENSTEEDSAQTLSETIETDKVLIAGHKTSIKSRYIT